MIRLRNFIKPYKKQIIFAPLAKFVETVFELIIPILTAILIDSGIKNNDVSLIIQLSAISLFLAILGFFISLVGQYLAVTAAQRFGMNLRNKVFEHINTFSYAELDKFGASALTTRLTADINQLQYMFMMVLRLVLRSPLLCIGSIIGALIIDWMLALILIAVIPIVGIILYLIINRAINLFRKVQTKLDDIALVVSENLTGIRIIKAFGRTDTERTKIEKAGNEHVKAHIKAGKLASLSNPLTALLVNFALIAILFLSGIRVNSGVMTQGEIIVFINYISQITLALGVLINLIVTITRALASADRIREILNTQTSIIDAGKILEKFPEGDIVFENVSFAYGEGKPTLKNVNITIKRQSTLGIVGLTGSGKTTFINLLSRFYDVTEGKITIGGKDIKDLSPSYLRSNIGIVPQQAKLFSGTIAENIRMGNCDITDEDIEKACQAAQADFVHRLPEGFNFVLKRGGINLSGGQRARLTIARALAKKHEILILDDAASALDYATEAKLNSVLKDDLHCTVLIISQRVSSLRNADYIVVLNEGSIAGFGTHLELLENCEIYREIYQTQLNIEGGTNV